MNRRRFLMSSSAISAGTIGSVHYSSTSIIAVSTNLTTPSSKTVSNDIEFTFSPFDVTVNNLSGERDIVAEYSLVHNQVELKTEAQTLGTASGSGTFTANEQTLKLRDFDLSKGDNQYELRIKILVKNGDTVEANAVTESDTFQISCLTGGISQYTLDSDDEFTDTYGNQKIRDAWSNNDATNNGVTFNSGIRENSGSFDGLSGHLDTNYTVSDTFTVCVWVRGEDFSHEMNPRIFDSSPNDSNGTRLYVPDGSSQLRFGNVTTGSRLTTDTQIETNVWYHIAAVSNSGSYSVYIDGQKDPETTNAGNINENSSLHIGIKADAGNDYWRGNMDDIRLYDRALSESEIQDLYESYNVTQ